MSERKSWDVVRKPSPPARPASAQVPGVPVATRRASAPRLREQRRKQRRLFWVVVGMLLAALAALALYIIWLPATRVHAITVQGQDADGAKQQAWNAVSGTYAYIIPRNSIFFLPQEDIRKNILKAYPDIAAISIKPSSLDAITIIPTGRETAFVWCGANVDAPPADGTCYTADADGLIFAPLDPTTTNASSTLRIFAALDKNVPEGTSPIRTHVVAANKIPDALRFTKMLRGLGEPISALAISGDEGTFYVNGPTKIMYVLGHEDQAAQLAASALPTLHLTDGSIDYVDLRFTPTPGQPGKVYVKKFGQ